MSRRPGWEMARFTEGFLRVPRSMGIPRGATSWRNVEKPRKTSKYA